MSRLILTICLLTGLAAIGWASSGPDLQPKASKATTNTATPRVSNKTTDSVCPKGKQLVGYDGPKIPICADKPK